MLVLFVVEIFSALVSTSRLVQLWAGLTGCQGQQKESEDDQDSRRVQEHVDGLQAAPDAARDAQVWCGGAARAWPHPEPATCSGKLPLPDAVH